MASLIDRNGTYYAQFYDANRTPKSKRLSLRTSDKSIARRRLAKWEEDAAYGKLDPWFDDPWTYRLKEEITVGKAFEMFLEAKRKANLSSSTLDLYYYNLSRLIRQVGRGTLLRRLTSAEIDVYVRAGEVARSTQQKRYRIVRAFLHWAVRHDLLDLATGHLGENGKAARS